MSPWRIATEGAQSPYLGLPAAFSAMSLPSRDRSACSLVVKADGQLQPAFCSVYEIAANTSSSAICNLRVCTALCFCVSSGAVAGRVGLTRVGAQELEAASAGYGVCKNSVSIKRFETGHRSSARASRIEANFSSALSNSAPTSGATRPQLPPRGAQCMVHDWCRVAEAYFRSTA
jgi:hypothetical protein